MLGYKFETCTRWLLILLSLNTTRNLLLRIVVRAVYIHVRGAGSQVTMIGLSYFSTATVSINTAASNSIFILNHSRAIFGNSPTVRCDFAHLLAVSATLHVRRGVIITARRHSR